MNEQEKMKMVRTLTSAFDMLESGTGRYIDNEKGHDAAQLINGVLDDFCGASPQITEDKPCKAEDAE